MTVSHHAGGGLERIVQVETKYGRQCVFSLTGRFSHEFVRTSLQQERRVDERVIVHTDDIPDFGVGFDNRICGQRAGVLRVAQHEQVQLGLPTPRASAAAYCPIILAPRLEIQLDPALVLAMSNQGVVVTPSGARLAPQAPGDGIQQRRLAVPVVPTQTGDMDALKIQRGHIIAVTKKVANGQFEGNHGSTGNREIMQNRGRTQPIVPLPLNPPVWLRGDIPAPILRYADAIIIRGLSNMGTMTNQAGDTSAAPIIVVQDLRKRYGDIQAVDGVTFSVGKGEVFALLGPNGSGKTTTIEIVEGMRSADSGTATVAGIDVSKDAGAVKQIIGVQLQSSAFFEHLHLSELLMMLGSIYGIRVDPEPLLEAVDLAERRKASFRTLSGGQKQRFAIAASLVNDPAVIFLDEPTTGLDPQARRRMWDLMRDWKTQGRTIVLTTHYMEEAEELCDRVAVMDRGHIITMDTPATLIDELIGRGFQRTQAVRSATLEDVFLDLTGRSLREM